MNNSSQHVAPISVALPTYNGEPHLRELLDSILSQTVSPIEIVITDDGSTDGSLKTLEEYGDKYPDIIRLFKNKSNLGVAKNFERAITKSRGEVIALADQDDVWKPEKLERQLTALRRENAGMVCHNSIIVTEDLVPVGELWDSVNFNPTNHSPKTLLEDLLKRNFVQGTTIMFNSNLRDRLLPIPDVGFYDHSLAILGHVIGGLYPINDTLLKYRQHGEQDRGAPPGFQSFLNQLQLGIKKEPQKSIRDEEQIQEIFDRVQEMSECSFTLNPPLVYKLMGERLAYDKSRRYIHTSEQLLQSTKKFGENLKAQRYPKFGYGPAGTLSMGRDLLGIVSV